VTPVVKGGADCQKGQVLRSFLSEETVGYARFDPVFAARPKVKVNVRRAGQSGGIQPNTARRHLIQRASKPDDHDEKPVDLQLRINMQFCEGLDTIRVVGGHLSLAGQIGHYQMRYDTPLISDTQDEIHMKWRHKAVFNYEPDALGEFSISFTNQPFDARHDATKSKIDRLLRLNFHVQFMPQAGG